MEERLPESSDDSGPPPLATYVVQVPRDQIYRVPPPEHALKIEEHKRNIQNQDAKRRSQIRSVAIPVIAVAVIAIVAIVTVRETLYAPATPQFAVTGIRARGPEFRVSIRATNRNPRMSVTYKGGGQNALIYKNKKIGTGSKIEGGGGADLAVVVVAVSPEVMKSLRDEKEKPMEVRVGLKVEMKSWARNIEGMGMMISCDFGVRNSLMNVTEISFTECKKL